VIKMPEENENSTPKTGSEGQKEEVKKEESVEEKIFDNEDSKQVQKEEEKKADEETKEEKVEEKKEAKEEEKKEEEKKEEEEEKRVIPDKYELSLPENSPLSKSVLDKIASEAKELRLTNEEAQELVEREHNAVTSYVKEQQVVLANRSEAWVTEVKEDKELGGEDFEKNSELAKRVANTFCSESFLTQLNETGWLKINLFCLEPKGEVSRRSRSQTSFTIIHRR